MTVILTEGLQWTNEADTTLQGFGECCLEELGDGRRDERPEVEGSLGWTVFVDNQMSRLIAHAELSLSDDQLIATLTVAFDPSLLYSVARLDLANDVYFMGWSEFTVLQSELTLNDCHFACDDITVRGYCSL